MRGGEVRDREGGGAARVRKCLYLYLFFFKCWLIEPVRFGSVRFNLFQTLETETEPNRNFFVIF